MIKCQISVNISHFKKKRKKEKKESKFSNTKSIYTLLCSEYFSMSSMSIFFFFFLVLSLINLSFSSIRVTGCVCVHAC
jgi:hypothetical protein